MPSIEHDNTSQARAWLIVGLYVGVIYVTLPLAPRVWFSLSPFLISFSSAAIFVLAFPLACLAVFLLREWKKNRDYPVWKAALFVSLVLVSWLLILQVSITPAEILHLLEYGGLGYLIGRAAKLSGLASWSGLGCVGLAVLAGSGDEAIQYLLPNRVFEFRDVLLNMWCGTVGLVAWLLLLRPSSLPRAGKYNSPQIARCAIADGIVGEKAHDD